ncbi:MAG: hypothetical protein BTN85_0176 [Candidatus Methanohalarchaeum thermophilum]|uniref:Uncharacterized protein n=1 Tax=Methanohalarchaeum thermophilum TaxID=1903181 RepID=A0A1Q6DTQ1_METT1|nr:MAG: hypothetical protein BTN85_0176 [Candidatus Methanohalarchaeum thermophilum]
MVCFGLIRADDSEKLKKAIDSLDREIDVDLDKGPKRFNASRADDILTKVLDSPLKNECEYAALCKINEKASRAINIIQDTRPPAHIIILSQKHDVYDQVRNSYNKLRELNL